MRNQARSWDMASDPLDGGWNTEVVRSGDTVLRSPRPSSPAVMSLLRFLASNGFVWAPRPVGSGFAPDGHEHLTYVLGESPQPYPWTDEAAVRIGEMVRHLHDVTSRYSPPDDARWLTWWGRDLGDSRRGFGHGDLGPWNIMAEDGMPSGFIDWDSAGPYDPAVELAQVAWLNAQLHDDDIAERIGLGSATDRARQLACVLDGYELRRSDRAGFVDRMVEFAVHSARADAVEHNVTPGTNTATAADGFPFLWGITWRVRSASWMLRNRRILESAIL